MAHLELREICKGFDKPVLDRMNLTVEEGEFFVVVGPSGIGKTTLLRCIAGLEMLDAGRVLIDGRDVTRVPPYRRRVAMTFESYALYPHLTVFENIASPLRARKIASSQIAERVTSVAKLLRIDPLLTRKPHEISGGQKQRTALGRTLVAQPDIFLLDEPISHLDAKIRHELRRQFHVLEELRRVATVYVTHDYAEALSLGDRVGVMGHGGLEQIGSAKEVFRRPRSLFVARHLGQPSINELDCRLVEEAGTLRALAGQSRLALAVAPHHRQMLQARNQDEVTLGIRPQHISVLRAGEGASDDGAIAAKVSVFEALGATGVLIADIGGLEITALTPPDEHFEVGQSVQLAMEAENCLYFSRERGLNLEL